MGKGKVKPQKYHPRNHKKPQNSLVATVQSIDREVTPPAPRLGFHLQSEAHIAFNYALSLLSPGLITHLPLSHLRALLFIAPLVACH